MVASPQSSQAAGTLLFQGRLEVRLTSSGSCCGAKDTDGREVAHSRSPPLCQVRGALGWLPPRKHAGSRRVGPSKLRTEISAGLGLDSDLPRQLAASLRSARVAGARHLLSGTSPQRDALSLQPPRPPLTHREQTDRRPEADHCLSSARSDCGAGGGAGPAAAASPALPSGSSHIPPPSQHTR